MTQEEETANFRMIGEKDSLGTWDFREASGPSGSRPCLPVVQLYQVTIVLAFTEK